MTTVRDLVAELGSAGDLPAAFGPLLEAVPRERFIPDRIWVNREPIDRAVEPERWLRAVYADESIVTQFDDGRTVWPDVGRLPTCSASMPSVVVAILDALHVRPGQRVLEVGTGTGYNAALLGELVGDAGSVVTVEIDDGLARVAERHLKEAGYERVRVVTGDGMQGVADGAPYDRIIATMSVHLGRIPYIWVQQTRQGGTIITPVRAELASGPLVAFTVHGDGTATGRTLPMGVGFIESRSQRTPEALDDDYPEDGADQRVTRVAPWPLLQVPSPRWALAAALPSCRYDLEPGRWAWLRDPVSGSRASVVPLDDGRYLVRQIGPRRLWDEAEAAYRWWQSRGEPFITEWRWTMSPERQAIHLPG